MSPEAILAFGIAFGGWVWGILTLKAAIKQGGAP